MSKKSTGISEQWLIDKGYTLGPNGAWTPPALKSKYIQSLKEPIVEKREVTHSPDFEFKGITTEWWVPYQIPSKKNNTQLYVNKHTGRPGTTTSAKYKEYVVLTKNYWTVFGREFKKSVELLGLQYPLNIEFTFVRKTNQIFDYIGLAQGAQDLMVEFGFFEDDSHRFVKPFFGDAQVDKDKPGTKIRILTK